MFRNLARTLAREAGIVTINLGQAGRQRPTICMTNKMQPHIRPVTHTAKDFCQGADRRFRNLCDTGFEMDGWHQITELDRFEFVANGFAHFQRIAFFRVNTLRILYPLRHGFVTCQMSFDRFANGFFIHFGGHCRESNEYDARQY